MSNDPGPTNHFYTTSDALLAGWTHEGKCCYIYPTEQNGAVKLHKWVYLVNNNHYYKTNGDAVAGWQYDGIEGYVFVSQYPGTVPFYHWWHPGTGDNFYTLEHTGELAPSQGYERIDDAFYVFAPPGVPGAVPLHRWVYPPTPPVKYPYCVNIWAVTDVSGAQNPTKFPYAYYEVMALDEIEASSLGNAEVARLQKVDREEKPEFKKNLTFSLNHIVKGQCPPGKP